MIRLAMDDGALRQAATRAETLFSNELILFHKSFPALDENGRLNLKSRFEPGRWLCTLGEPKSIARTLLQTKAITLDQMLALPTPQASVDDRFAYLLRPENAAQGLLPYSPAPVDAATPAQSPPKVGTAAAVSKNPPFSLYSITPEQVCASLPSDTVIVELTRYNHYVGWFVDEERYGALVFRPDGKGAQSLQWVPLGAADKIDHEVSSLLESATDPLASGTLATRLRELHELIWAPIAKAIPAGTQNVFICPDGQLCFLPFSTLLDPQGVFLADHFLVMYLATARDLFRADPAGKIETDQFAVFAAPSFDKTTATQDRAPGFRFRDADARSLQDLQLADLPGARREADILKTLASERRLTPDVYTGEAANKANVGKLERPRIVHFATHGFMLPPAVTTAFSNPMDRSGLALAGAQVSLTAMANGQPLPPVGEDGLLTAREVAQLDWQGTWLVTLSACSTGRGEVRDGESVLGLRRGFLAAGVENLLLSLWKISDEETVGFMRDFYTHALDSSDPATALALTQREWLARIRKERGIAAAVSTAGAFVLNTSARLPRPVDNTDSK
ncbi:MAG: CHAT domain-containing protein [Opitutaceae bacterium]|nr:CHAT domain-containing protein [Opitutaceae bacterium]